MMRAFAIECAAALGGGTGLAAAGGGCLDRSRRAEPREERAVEALAGVEVPTRAEAGGLQLSDRLIAADGTLYLSALVPAGPHARPPVVPVTFIQAGRYLITVRYSAVGALDP
ncbi:MAG: hypothetical protein U1E17_08390 [Geminicoccaceae bacterium]